MKCILKVTWTAERVHCNELRGEERCRDTEIEGGREKEAESGDATLGDTDTYCCYTATPPRLKRPGQNRKNLNDKCYVMWERFIWRRKKINKEAPCIIQRKRQRWHQRESGTGELLGVKIQFPQVTHSPQNTVQKKMPLLSKNIMPSCWMTNISYK